MLIQEVAHLAFFGFEITGGTFMGRDDAGNPLRHVYPAPLQRGDFVGVIRQQPYAANAEFPQDFGRHAIVAQVRLKAQALVGFHGIEAGILQFVGAKFVQKPDAAALLVFIDQNPAALLRRSG